MQIQIDRNGERYGPYSIEEVNSCLANGTLLSSDNAWHDGMPDWVPIGQIQGVILPGGGASPPLPSSAAGGSNCPQCQAPVEPSQVICMGCGHRLQGEATTSQGSKKILWISLGAVAVVGLAVGGYFLFSSDQPADEEDDKAGVEKGGSGGGGAIESGDWGSSGKNAVKSLNNIGNLGKGILAYSQDHGEKMPVVDKWCDDIFNEVIERKIYISPQASNAKELNLEEKHCHYAMNAEVAGKRVFGKVVVLFECDLGWNGSGGLADAKKFAEDRKATKLAVNFADGSSKLISPEDLDSLRWTP